MKNVIVFVEHRQGSTRKVTFELASEARRLADRLGGTAAAVAIGSGATELAEQLKAYPLDTIYVNDDRDADAFLLDPVVDYLQAAAELVGLALILIPNTLSGRDVAGRSVVRLNAGIVADVVEVRVDDDAIVCVSPKLGGVMITSCALRSRRVRHSDRSAECIRRLTRRQRRRKFVALAKPAENLRRRDRARHRGRCRRTGARGSARRRRGRAWARRPGAFRCSVETPSTSIGRSSGRLTRRSRRRLGAV